MKRRDRLKEILQFLGFALGMFVIVTLNLIAPLMILLSSMIYNTWLRLLLALGILLLCETVICAILVKTTSKQKR